MLLTGARTLVCSLIVGSSLQWGARPLAARGHDAAAPHVSQVTARSIESGFSDAQAPDIAAPIATLPPDMANFESTPLRRIHRVTAYCDRGITAAGVESGVGQCAAPADVPLGSLIVVPSLNRTFVVTDRTAQRFRHNTVDIFIPDRSDCLQFGLNYLEVEIYVPKAPPRYASPAFETLIRAFARG